MGTDIHLAVEVNQSWADTGLEIAGTTALATYRPWLMVGNDSFGSSAYGLFGSYAAAQTDEERRAYWDSDPGGRNYNLFAFLAGVRNGSGFAGSYRHEPIEPLFAGRGLPPDLDAGEYSDLGWILESGDGFKPSNEDEQRAFDFLKANFAEVQRATKKADKGGRVLMAILNLKERATTPGERKAAEAAEARWRARYDGVSAVQDDEDGRFWPGDHSWTWATFNELKSAPWDKEFASAGVVKASAVPDDYSPESGWQPQSWSGGIVGPGIVVYDYQTWCLAGKPTGAGDYLKVYWKWRPLAECSFRRWVDGPLTKCAERYGAENVRVVMGFDS